MATNFPTSVDNFTNPTANDSLNIPSHSLQHANANDAIEAVESFLLGQSGISYNAYTPTWTATGGTPILGNGTLQGYYTQIGKTVTGRVYLYGGSTTSVGTTTQWQFGLPIAMKAPNYDPFSVIIYNANTGGAWRGIGYSTNGTTITTRVTDSNSIQDIGYNNPVAFTSNVIIGIHFIYEVS